MAITRDDRKRRSVLIRELSKLSRNGWADARPVDYVPLEAELAQINARDT